MYTYAVNLVRVVDGDTVVLDVDLGFKTWLRGVKFRLASINAPELRTPAGELAKASMLTRPIATVTSTGLDK